MNTDKLGWRFCSQQTPSFWLRKQSVSICSFAAQDKVHQWFQIGQSPAGVTAPSVTISRGAAMPARISRVGDGAAISVSVLRTAPSSNRIRVRVTETSCSAKLATPLDAAANGLPITRLKKAAPLDTPAAISTLVVRIVAAAAPALEAAMLLDNCLRTPGVAAETAETMRALERLSDATLVEAALNDLMMTLRIVTAALPALVADTTLPICLKKPAVEVDVAEIARPTCLTKARSALDAATNGFPICLRNEGLEPEVAAAV
jgi:hypothetical protein